MPIFNFHLTLHFLKFLGFDLHLEWCGHCSNMEQNYRNLYLQFDEDFKKMEFWSCEASLMPEEVMADLEHGALTSQPRFLIFVEGEKRAEIRGADFPEIETAIGQNIPNFGDEDGF